MTTPETALRFLSWFHAAGGVSSDKMSIQKISNEMGFGCLATADIAEGEMLFTLPRELVLSIYTAALPSLLRVEEWQSVNVGWTGLILSIMYEKLQGHRWAAYLDFMPTKFDSLMFWSDDELKELQASSVLGKIGKQQAEDTWYKLVLPLIKSRNDIFTHPGYDISLFHLIGSQILSRSFDIDVDSSADEQDDNSVDVTIAGNSSIESSDDDPEEEDEGAENVGMVPFADVLNAKAGANNNQARLFYEANQLEMRATETILAGSQIYNTYAEPPNSDLLRRYGHVDVPNPNDVVEIDANLIAEVVCSAVKNASELKADKVEWLLESGLDDTFSFSMSDLLPDEFLSCVLLFACPQAQYMKIKEKSEPPIAQSDKNVLKLVAKIVKARLDQYSSTIEEDEQLLKQTSSNRMHMALIVRVGEKRILNEVLQTCSKQSGKRKRE